MRVVEVIGKDESSRRLCRYRFGDDFASDALPSNGKIHRRTQPELVAELVRPGPPRPVLGHSLIQSYERRPAVVIRRWGNLIARRLEVELCLVASDHGVREPIVAERVEVEISSDDARNRPDIGVREIEPLPGTVFDL